MSATTFPDSALFNRTAIKSFDLRARAGQLAIWLTALVLLAAAFFAGPASAAVDLRVESRPIGNPIEAYVTVTDANGNPVGGLTAGSFTLTLDGTPVPIQPSDFSLPPSANPDKNVSVVFAMDYSSSTSAPATRAAMQTAVVDFVNSMNVGDYAAIVKFNAASGATIIQQLTRIDGAAGTDALVNAAMLPYDGIGSNVYDGINVALEHFVAPPAGVTLPAGPKAVVVISDGLDNNSVNLQGFVIDKASSLGIPLFTIAVGTPGTTGSNVMNALAARTGGTYISAPTQSEITGAYATISGLLDNGYLITFASSITDCNPHTLSVTVTGQGTTETRFTRCDATTGPVTVPNVVNQTQAAAAAALSGVGLVVGTVTQQSSANDSGRPREQPEPGRRRRRNGRLGREPGRVHRAGPASWADDGDGTERREPDAGCGHGGNSGCPADRRHDLTAIEHDGACGQRDQPEPGCGNLTGGSVPPFRSWFPLARSQCPTS